MRAKRRDRRLERVRGVRIVNVDRRACTADHRALEPPANRREPLHRREDAFENCCLCGPGPAATNTLDAWYAAIKGRARRYVPSPCRMSEVLSRAPSDSVRSAV